MRFDAGLFDRLFGKRVTAEFRNRGGRPGTREVTERWLDEQTEARRMTKVDGVVKVNIADPFRGCYVDHWR